MRNPDRLHKDLEFLPYGANADKADEPSILENISNDVEVEIGTTEPPVPPPPYTTNDVNHADNMPDSAENVEEPCPGGQTSGESDDGDDDLVGLSMFVESREPGHEATTSSAFSRDPGQDAPATETKPIQTPNNQPDDLEFLPDRGEESNIPEANTNVVEFEIGVAEPPVLQPAGTANNGSHEDNVPDFAANAHEIETSPGEQTPSEPDDEDGDLQELRIVLRNCATCTRNLIELLVKERAVFMKVHKDCLISSTVGTSVSTFGTVLSVLGLIGIPITLGSSLILTGVGAAMVTTGAATSIGTSVARSVLNKKTAERINEAMERYFESSDRLNDSVRRLSTRWNAVSCARVSSEAGIAILRANWTFLRRGLTDLLSLFDVSRKVAYVTSVKFLGAVARALSFIGVALQAVDIAFLVKDWNAKHPQAGAVDEFIQQLRTILREIEEVLARIE